MQNIAFLLLIALLLLTTFGGHIVIMAMISLTMINLLDTEQMFAEHEQIVLRGTLLLGLIMTGILGVILLHHTR